MAGGLAGGVGLAEGEAGAEAGAEAEAGADCRTVAGGVELLVVRGAATVAEAAPAGRWTGAVCQVARLVCGMVSRPFVQVCEAGCTDWTAAAALLGSLTTLGATGKTVPGPECRETVRAAAVIVTTMAAAVPPTMVVLES